MSPGGGTSKSCQPCWRKVKEGWWRNRGEVGHAKDLEEDLDLPLASRNPSKFRIVLTMRAPTREIRGLT